MKVTFEGTEYVFPEDATQEEIFDFLLRNSEQDSSSFDVGKAMGKESKQFAGDDQVVEETAAVMPDEMPKPEPMQMKAPSMFGLDLPPPQVEGPVAQQEAPAPTQPYAYKGGDMPPLRAGMLSEAAPVEEAEEVPTLDQRIGERIAQDEGYSSKLTMNVPSDKSGITIAGVDLAKFDGDLEEVLKDYIPEPVLKKLIANRNLTGEAAKEFIRDNGLKVELSDEQIREIPAKAHGAYVDKIKNKIGPEAYDRLPDEVKVPLVALTWLNFGPKSLTALAKALKTDAKEDWKAVLEQYENYWKKPTEHNKMRSDNVAKAIREWKGL